MVTLADARRVIAAAEKEAEKQGQPMNIAVVDAGGYAQAAESLHKSQSTLTYAVQKLERLRQPGRGLTADLALTVFMSRSAIL